MDMNIYKPHVLSYCIPRWCIVQRYSHIPNELSKEVNSKVKVKKSPQQKDESVALLRVTQMLAAGQDVDVIDF